MVCLCRGISHNDSNKYDRKKMLLINVFTKFAFRNSFVAGK